MADNTRSKAKETTSKSFEDLRAQIQAYASKFEDFKADTTSKMEQMLVMQAKIRDQFTEVMEWLDRNNVPATGAGDLAKEAPGHPTAASEKSDGDDVADLSVELCEVEVVNVQSVSPLVPTTSTTQVYRFSVDDASVDNILKSLSEDEEIVIQTLLPVPEANSVLFATQMPSKFEPKQPLFFHEKQSTVAIAWRKRTALWLSLTIPSDGTTSLLLTPARSVQVLENKFWILRPRNKGGGFERQVCDDMPQWQSSSFTSISGTVAIAVACVWVELSFRHVTNVTHDWVTRATSFKGGTPTTVRRSLEHVRRVSDLLTGFSSCLFSHQPKLFSTQVLEHHQFESSSLPLLSQSLRISFVLVGVVIVMIFIPSFTLAASCLPNGIMSVEREGGGEAQATSATRRRWEVEVAEHVKLFQFQ